MAAEYPLSLIIKAVDRATAPLRAINQRIQKFTAPVRKLNNSFRALAEEAGLPRLVNGFAGVGRAVGRVGSEVLALGAKIAAMGAAAGLALYAMMRGAVNAGDDLATMADRVGLTVDAYAQLRYAAEQADVSQQEFASSMDRFNRSLGEAKAGTGSLLSFLERVSPALALQVRGAKSTDEALALMTRAFEKVKDPAKRAALGNAAFGRSGMQMAVFLGQGEKAILAQRQRYSELAGSQEKFALGAGALDNAMRETREAFGGLSNAAAGELFPALTDLAQALTNLLAGNRARVAEWAREVGTAISSWVQGGGLRELVDTMKQWGTTIAGVIEKLGGMKGVLIAVGTYMALPALAAVASLTVSLFTLGSAALPMVIKAGALLLPVLGKILTGFLLLNLANPVVWIVAGVAALGAAALAIYKYWEPIKAFFIDLWEKVRPIFDGMAKLGSWNPIGLAGKAGQWIGGKLFGAEAGPALNASSAAPLAPGASSSSARVAVDFSNLPRGARVTPDPSSTADIDLSMGWSMVGGT